MTSLSTAHDEAVPFAELDNEQLQRLMNMLQDVEEIPVSQRAQLGIPPYTDDLLAIVETAFFQRVPPTRTEGG